MKKTDKHAHRYYSWSKKNSFTVHVFVTAFLNKFAGLKTFIILASTEYCHSRESIFWCPSSTVSSGLFDGFFHLQSLIVSSRVSGSGWCKVSGINSDKIAASKPTTPNTVVGSALDNDPPRRMPCERRQASSYFGIMKTMRTGHETY